VSDPRGLLVVIAGPSGVGKGTVHARVRAALPESVLSVSMTTRPPREGERDGVHYHFVDLETFERRIADGALLEWAEYAGHRYGTPRQPAEEAIAQGRVVVLDIELQGALQVKQHDPDALLVFLEPPSFQELERRLRARGTEDPDAIARRLDRAWEELAAGDRFDVRVVNDDLDRCVAEVLAAIEARRHGHART
jgi:guanylate kinase